MQTEIENSEMLNNDLVYYIERIAGLKPIDDLEKFNRIDKKTAMIEHKEEKELYYTTSDFATMLYIFSLTILRLDEFVKEGPKALSLYPELVKERLNSVFLIIASDYSETPGGRYIADGNFSGEDFRDNCLEPRYLKALALNKKLVICFDGGYGYSVGFLEETFGGMIRKGYSSSDILNNIVFISNQDPNLVKTITNFMLDEEERLKRVRKNEDTKK